MVKEIKYKPRVTDSELRFKLESKGVVLIEGPKWCGKTTSAKRYAKSYVEFGGGSAGKQLINLAKTDTDAILPGDTPRLFDEWQEVPELWDAIRTEVDRRNDVGQFILTGSTIPFPKDNSNTTSHVHSGTGRFSFLKMRPMSLFESGESNGKISLKELFETPEKIAAISDLSLGELAFAVCRGGWPFATSLSGSSALSQAEDYYAAIVHNDISKIDNVSRNPATTKKIMRAYARRQGSPVSNVAMANDAGVSKDSILSYGQALDKIFATEHAEAWNANLRSKTAIRTTNTCYYIDPSLATTSLRTGPDGLMSDLNTFGFIFETLCMRDLRIYSSPLHGTVYHYRDKNNREADAVVSLPDGRYGLIEMKLGQIDEVLDEAAELLNSISDDVDVNKMPAPAFKMILTGNGKTAYRREDGVYVVPIGCLKP